MEFSPQKNDYIDYLLSSVERINRISEKMYTTSETYMAALQEDLDRNKAIYDTSKAVLIRDYGLSEKDFTDKRLQRAKDRLHPCSLAYVASKRGTGKTTLAVTTGTILASKGWRVLTIDLDDLCNTTTNLGISFHEITRFKHSSSDLFDPDLKDPSELVIRPFPKDLPTLSLIPSTFLLMNRERELNYILKNDPFIEARVLSRNLLRFKHYFDQFDYIVYDTKSSLSQVNENCFAALDTMVFVTDTSLNSLVGLTTQLGYWRRVASDIRLVTPYNKCIVLNKLQNTNLDREVYALLTGKKVYNDSKGRSQEIERLMLDSFGQLYKLFIDAPIRMKSAVKEVEKPSLPLVLNQTRATREAYMMFEALVNLLFDKGYLEIHEG
ncbi:MAG: AAA family ATPase [Prevotellaceae bacterium]|nr:AAA family ATPase [Prevotellaceae bacterium]